MTSDMFLKSRLARARGL